MLGALLSATRYLEALSRENQELTRKRRELPPRAPRVSRPSKGQLTVVPNARHTSLCVADDVNGKQKTIGNQYPSLRYSICRSASSQLVDGKVLNVLSRT